MVLKDNKKSFKIISKLFILLGLAAIVIGIILEIVNIYTKSVIRYAGYKFKIPEDCTATVKENIGLIIKTKDNDKYVIGVDYTNSYDDYDNCFKKIYFPPIETFRKKVGDREYTVCDIMDESLHGSGGRYYTSVNNQVFSGLIIKRDLSMTEQDDYEFLNKILESAKKVSDVIKGSKEDIGSKSIEIKTFVESDFS